MTSSAFSMAQRRALQSSSYGVGTVSAARSIQRDGAEMIGRIHATGRWQVELRSFTRSGGAATTVLASGGEGDPCDAAMLVNEILWAWRDRHAPPEHCMRYLTAAGLHAFRGLGFMPAQATP